MYIYREILYTDKERNREIEDAWTSGLETYPVTGISEHASFLEMLDVLNEQLINEGKEPVAFDHDCREGICGMCSLYINGEAHGPDRKGNNLSITHENV